MIRMDLGGVMVVELLEIPSNVDVGRPDLVEFSREDKVVTLTRLAAGTTDIAINFDNDVGIEPQVFIIEVQP